MTKKIYFLLTATLFLSYSAFCQVSPITEDFNSVSSLSSSGWSLINRSEPNTVATWSQGNTALFSAQSGAPNSYIQSYGNLSSNALISNWLITPQRTLHNGDIFTFYTRNLTSAREALEVRLTTAGNSSNVGNTVTSTGDFNTVLLTINPSLVQGQYPSSWTKYTYTLSGLSGVLQGRIAFRHINAAPTGGTADVAIDNFTYTAYPVASRLYVDSSAAFGNNGLGWASPLKTLEEALSLARTYSNITEIWVKKGTYYPDEGPGRGNNDRMLSFNLKSGLAVYGGFAGTEISLNQRSRQTNATILSGDIDQVAGYEGNAFHVIKNNGINNTAILDGFTITAGNANGEYVNDSSYAYGGGMYNNSSSPSFVNCSFSMNAARVDGAGMYNISSSPSLVNCIFSQNTASYGGGMYNNSSSPSLVNCSFSQNTALAGGGMFNISSSPSLANCILWGNTNSQIYNFTGTWAATAAYSIVQGGYAGTNNLDANPLFVDASNPAGMDGIFGTADDGLRLGFNSPAINAGNNDSINKYYTATDVAGAARIQRDTVDIGAYESSLTVVSTGTLFVDSSIAASGNGFIWARAFKTLGEALKLANATPSIKQIWLAKGTYFPTGDGNRDSSFRILRNGLSLYGGFKSGDTSLNARNIVTNLTVLSGNIGNPQNSSDNSYHVITLIGNPSSKIDTLLVLDGLTIRDGNANGNSSFSYNGINMERNKGGAIYNYGAGNNNGCSPSIMNCTIANNISSHQGGALYNNGKEAGTSSPLISGCVFKQNNSTDGGAMWNDGSAGNSSTVIKSCFFQENSSTNYGGAIVNNGANGTSKPQIISSVFSQNTSLLKGGAVYNIGSTADAGKPLIIGCTFWSNGSDNGGGIYNEASSAITSPAITNCIFRNNSKSGNIMANGADIFNNNAVPAVNYTLTQVYNNGGTGNIVGVDPNFANPALPAGADGVFFTNDDGLWPQCGSPVINKGSNDAVSTNGIVSDVMNKVRIGFGRVDMGAYESYFSNGVTTGIIYVDSSKAASGDGGSWSSAVKTVAEALSVVRGCTDVRQVWVAKGTYFPTANGSRDSSFSVLRNGIQLYGGFAGNETALSARDYKTNRTILSGDIGIRGDSTDNSQRIMIITPLTADPIDSSTRIDGFTFEKAYSSGRTNAIDGGAIRISVEGSLEVYSGDGTTMPHVPRDSFICSPAISNCVFIQNTVGGGGGAISMSASYGTSSPVFTNCRFANNNSVSGGAVNTYAAYGISSPMYNNCSFTSNRALAAGGSGGAIATAFYYDAESKSIFTNCSFDDNECYNRGGAIFYFINADDPGPPDRYPFIAVKTQYINCIFNNNRARYGVGWALAETVGGFKQTDSTFFTNCTFTNNFSTADTASLTAIYYWFEWFTPEVFITNSIFWNNNNDETPEGEADIRGNRGDFDFKLTHSLIKNYSGNETSNVVGKDPLFVNAANPAGGDGILGTADDGLKLQAGSPAINAGNNDSIPAGITTDITGAARIQNGIVDMGAYEGAVTPAIYSITSGLWNSPATWSCNCVPQGNSQVNIKAGHTITITAAMGNLQCGKLTLEATSVFNVTGGLLKIVGSN